MSMSLMVLLKSLQRRSSSPRMPVAPFLALTNQLSRQHFPSRFVHRWICKLFPIHHRKPYLQNPIEDSSESNFNKRRACRPISWLSSWGNSIPSARLPFPKRTTIVSQQQFTPYPVKRSKVFFAWILLQGAYINEVNLPTDGSKLEDGSSRQDARSSQWHLQSCSGCLFVA